IPELRPPQERRRVGIQFSPDSSGPPPERRRWVSHFSRKVVGLRRNDNVFESRQIQNARFFAILRPHRLRSDSLSRPARAQSPGPFVEEAEQRMRVLTMVAVLILGGGWGQAAQSTSLTTVEPHGSQTVEKRANTWKE